MLDRESIKIWKFGTFKPRGRKRKDGHSTVSEPPEESCIFFELKVGKKFNEMVDGLDEVYRQIRNQKYEEGILDDGYAGVVSFGICFCKKSCIVGLMDK